MNDCRFVFELSVGLESRLVPDIDSSPWPTLEDDFSSIAAAASADCSAELRLSFCPGSGSGSGSDEECDVFPDPAVFSLPITEPESELRPRSGG